MHPPHKKSGEMNLCGKKQGYAAGFSSPFICLMAFFTFQSFSYRAIMKRTPLVVHTVYTLVPVEPSDVSPCIVLCLWGPSCNKVRDTNTVVSPSVILQCADQGTITPFHLYKLKKLLVCLFFSQSLPFILCYADITRIVVSQTSW